MSDGRVRPRLATIAISAVLALAGAAEWQALYAQAKNAPAKNSIGCVQSAQETSGKCAGDAGK